MRTDAILILITVGVLGLALPAAAATIPVTTTNPAVAADGQCSLIEAVMNANTDTANNADCPAGSGADTIELASSATYVFDDYFVDYYGPTALPVITTEITFEGRDSTINRAAAAPAFRLMVVNDSGKLSVRDLTLEGGDSGPTYCGGALLNAFGSADLTRTTVTGSTAPSGGGICNSSGPMTLTNCVLTLNTARDGQGGGLLSIDDVGTPTLVVDQTSVTNNSAVFSGGIGANDTEVTITDSTISGNQAYSADGYAFCGGLGFASGVAEIHRSTISDNTAQSLADLSGFGGGVCVSDNRTTISNSTISGNEALGATTTGSATTGRGGGIIALGGAWGVPPSVDTLVVVEDSTICDNTAETYGGGISANRFAGDMAVTVELRNTIVADNYEGGGSVLGNCMEESPAVVASFDFNLADDATCNLIGTDDLVVADVMLAPLADHGGPTWTHLPETGSPAIDSGDDGMCQAIDQHGNIRPWDGDGNGSVHCDRGAVELSAPYFHNGFETGDTGGWDQTNPPLP
ncbi:MAG: choice-of-anchor Q domain-containing protein [Thermoanaerobaculales bacterium]|jgi:hypothetical protein|nr:choice-of-anchor Q domain-containing protein [Thermoanaerobaculales bacterium]